MIPWDTLPLLLNNAASRAGQAMCVAVVPAFVLWVCVCKLGMV